ncbi:hypothetical protein WUBG_05930 [Wuchereria bancrofti]|uniref:Uncharacterized protein n=1 Tax=Wuchereria bancrofti TaxID=6293 RepID=J9B7Y9_WUCBA|nr:hypothetical protein WUBG_05930 [Wuchereria bancrofti]
MFGRDRYSTMNENIPAKPSGRSTSANGGISQKKLSENSLQNVLAVPQILKYIKPEG